MAFRRAAIAAVVMAAALGWWAPAGLDGQAGAGARCRRVQLTGTITVTPAPKPGFRGTVNAADGTFKMDLIFPEKGGEVRYQQNTVTLTRLKSHAFGGARDCTNTLSAEATAPRPFIVWASLGVDLAVTEDANQKVKSVSDQFDLLMKTQPTAPPVTYQVLCEGGRPGPSSDYGTSIPQLLQIFSRTQYSGSVTLNRMGDRRHLPDVELMGGMRSSAEWEVLETIVPCANFQYR